MIRLFFAVHFHTQVCLKLFRIFIFQRCLCVNAYVLSGKFRDVQIGITFSVETG